MQKEVSTLALALSFTAIIALAFEMIACGSSSSNKNLTQAQAQQVAGAVSTSVTQSIAAALGGADASRNGLTRIEQPSPNTSSSGGCTSSDSGTSCNWTISSTYSCPSGGTIAVSGSVGGTVNSSESGSIAEQVTATPASCVVDGLTINGDPSITVAGSVNLSDGAVVWPVTGSETGGVTYGPNPSGTCTFNVNYSVTVSGSSLSCTITGTACGQTISGSC